MIPPCTVPLLKPGKKKKAWYSDRILALLVKEKKAAWDEWKAGGRPISGDTHGKW